MIERAEAPESRRRAREAALSMLYQWEVGRADLADVLRQGGQLEGEPLPERTHQFAATLVRGTVEHLEAIDTLIQAHAEHWRLSRLAVVDRLILRLAVYELLHEPHTPGKVVINEAIELAKTFSAPEAAGFVNGVLDGIRRRLAEGGEARSGDLDGEPPAAGK